MFYSYTDGYPEAHGNIAGSTAPLKAVILQTNWSYTNVNLQDVIFTEYKIINRNNVPWVNTYISIWTDDDLGDPLDDCVGIDTSLMLSYTYNFEDNDPVYGAAPPAVGFLTLRNPIVPSIGDTARYYNPPGSNNLIIKPNYKEMDLSSFNMFVNADPSIGDPRNYTETYFNQQGFQRLGTSWINPSTSQPSKFPYSGDPVTSTGWLQTSGNDRRSLMSIGPLTMNPNDTQSVIVAQVIARGTSNTNSVAVLRNLSNYVRGVYENNFQGVLSIKNVSSEIPSRFTLGQNYPNPFNPSTVIRYLIKENRFITLKVFDILGNEVSTLVNQKQTAGSYEVEFEGSNLSSGIYFYKLETEGFTDTKRMILLK
ncbi:MAG: T9SS type A sorting domain-containing protein [Bacteroidota bacterium]|nr:T9SS type A sorting domain-containing protein [Bacteroidota bacterium]